MEAKFTLGLLVWATAVVVQVMPAIVKEMHSNTKLNQEAMLTCACDPMYCNENTCKTDGVCFVSLTRNKTNPKNVIRGARCIDKPFLIPPHRPFICEYSRRQGHLYKSKCCSEKDLCNLDIVMELDPYSDQPMKPSPFDSVKDSPHGDPTPIEQQDMSQFQILLAILIPIIALVIVLPCIILVTKKNRLGGNAGAYLFPCCTSEACCRPGFYQEVDSIETQSTFPVATHCLNDYLNVTSGSGSGLPLLVQRSVARQITLVNVIGKGRFGEVWKGSWRGESVAVKIFSTVDEKSWFREVEIYQTVMLRHPNILGFIAADNKDNGAWTQLWLIMEHMPNGSLYDYLRVHTISEQQLIKLGLSIANGLAHLHMEIVGTHGKPGIAHRDIKSKNILVRGDGMSCAIGDLGLAVKFNSESNVIDLPHNSKSGTRRYLAPELLDDTLNTKDFEAFKRADVYSVGLVLWELAKRCRLKGQKPSDYSAPFGEYVGMDPSLDEMRKVVCIDGARPSVPNVWVNDPMMSRMIRLMNECWYERPAARLTAFRVKKTLQELKNANEDDENEKLPFKV